MWNDDTCLQLQESMQGVQSHPPQQDLYDPFTEFQSLARKNVSAADSIWVLEY